MHSTNINDHYSSSCTEVKNTARVHRILGAESAALLQFCGIPGMLGQMRGIYQKKDLFPFPLNAQAVHLSAQQCTHHEHLMREIQWNIASITKLNNKYKQGMCKHPGGNQKVGMFISHTALTPQVNSV